MFVSILCKIAVPIFFMITGALLLKKEEPLRMLFVKHVLIFSLILQVVSLIYYIVLCDGWSVGDFIRRVYSRNITTGLWYLYSYLGILLILPFLRKLVMVLGEQDYIYLFAGRIILVGLFPIVAFLIEMGHLALNRDFSAVIFTADNLFYVLLGYYCEHLINTDSLTKKDWIALGSASLLAFGLTCFVTNIRLGGIGADRKSTRLNSSHAT